MGNQLKTRLYGLWIRSKFPPFDDHLQDVFLMKEQAEECRDKFNRNHSWDIAYIQSFETGDK